MGNISDLWPTATPGEYCTVILGDKGLLGTPPQPPRFLYKAAHCISVTPPPCRLGLMLQALLEALGEHSAVSELGLDGRKCAVLRTGRMGPAGQGHHGVNSNDEHDTSRGSAPVFPHTGYKATRKHIAMPFCTIEYSRG